MKILLVGATGFIGCHLLAALTAAGHHIVATSRRPRATQLPGIEWQVLDLAVLAENPDHFHIPSDVDLLINAAGLLSVDAHLVTLAQDQGTRALFGQARLKGVRVLHISALGADVQRDVPFLASKAAADAFLMEAGMSAVVLRPSLVVGEGGASSEWLMRLSPWPVIPVLDTQALVQPLHVDDLVGAVMALLRKWPDEAMVLPLVGPEPMTLPALIDQLRAAQGWRPARYWKVPVALTKLGAAIGDRLGWRALNRQSLRMASRDSLADPEVLASVCGYRCAPVHERLDRWPRPAQSVQLALRPVMLAVLVLIWLGTAFVSLGPGREWGLRIMAETGVTGFAASLLIGIGALCDAVLGLGLLLRRWRRPALKAQLLLMIAYTLIISVVLPHYWYDPYAAIAKNLVLMVATLWLYWTEPRR